MNDQQSLPEITLRGCLLAVVLTVIFTAANVYLGLKVGLTFSSSIPAAVISMALLRFWRDSNVLENNIVQTFASSTGTLTTVIFVLPAMVMLGFWQNFPYWQITILTALGGILGVMFTIPLRRALVVDSDLPFPEGTAAAEVLRAGSRHHQEEAHNKSLVGHPIRDISVGSGLSFLFSLCSNGFKLLSTSISHYGKIGSTIVSGSGLSFSFSLIGAGYLIGFRIAMSIVIGVIAAWGIMMPIISFHQVIPAGVSTANYTLGLWTHNIRFIGAGVFATASVWAVLKLLKPIFISIRDTHRHKNDRGSDKLPRHEQDIPMNWVVIISSMLVLPLIALFSYFMFSSAPQASLSLALFLVVICVFFAMFIGFIIASAAGYMAGLVGSSISPISGLAILAVLTVSLLLLWINHEAQLTAIMNTHFLVGLAVFTTGLVLAISAVSNDNLQDLKTGHLLGATPWKQQFVLILGVLTGALVIAPILNILYQAYGFSGAPLPNHGMDAQMVLTAPQATLVATLAKGVLGQSLHWGMLIIGGIIGIALLLFDNLILKAMHYPRLSIFCIGFGLYLPPEIALTVAIGGVLSLFVKRLLNKLGGDKKRMVERCGTLVACGLIVGDSIFGIILASIIGSSGNQHPLALVGAGFASTADILGVVVFLAILGITYHYIKRSQYSKALSD